MLFLSFCFFTKYLLWPLVQNKEYWNGLAIVPVMSVAFLNYWYEQFRKYWSDIEE